ncbi:MAG: zinc ABC transporter substrate-binding protein [Sphaerochaetaceae bacterium]|nr:zinc ABC transporter substrate-binding protein [Sphaerochaetaceae bacterium]
MKKKILKTIVLSILPLFLLIGCTKTENKETASFSSENKMTVVTTTAMIGDVASEIGKDRVEVYSMMGPGVDPHLYKAKTSDLERLTSSDLIIYNGIHLEAKMADVLEKLSSTKNIHSIEEGLDETNLITIEQAHDPHIWFDVQNWITASKIIRDALTSTDPDGKEIYQANYESYIAKLEELDTYVKSQAQKVPKEQRILITAHDAFNYFGRAYDFEVKGLQGISTVDEAGTLDVRNLAQFIAENKIKALFVESSVSPKSIQALQAAVESRGWNIIIGGELYSDAMGDANTFEGTYIGMVTHNIDTIVSGLLGEEE